MDFTPRRWPSRPAETRTGQLPRPTSVAALPLGELRVAAICGAAVMSAGVAGGRFAHLLPVGPPPPIVAICSR